LSHIFLNKAAKVDIGRDEHRGAQFECGVEGFTRRIFRWPSPTSVRHDYRNPYTTVADPTWSSSRYQTTHGSLTVTAYRQSARRQWTSSQFPYLRRENFDNESGEVGANHTHQAECYPIVVGSPIPLLHRIQLLETDSI